MLLRLSIRDFILVDRLELEFGSGFGVLTGETGAGKSILVDALAFVLGERADSALIRQGSEKSEVSAEFDTHNLASVDRWLREQDIDSGSSLLLRRVMDSGGRSRAYINGSSVTLQQLRDVSETLVDIHGQHAHQSLLRPEAQLFLLDSHARLEGLRSEVGLAWKAWREAKKQLDTAASALEALVSERQELECQVRELDALAFTLDEWRELLAEHKRLAHAATLLEGAEQSLNWLSEGDSACEFLIRSASARIQELAGYDPDLMETSSLLESARVEVCEAVTLLRRYAARIEMDPRRLGEIERRIGAVTTCARKYRIAPDALPDTLARSKLRMAALGDLVDIAGLQTRVAETRRHYDSLARDLGEARRLAATTLGSAVTRVMQQLALSGGQFEVALMHLETGTINGMDQIEFRISGLAGNEARSLAKVASGGELSRISLAIQVVTSQAASVPTLIFDEVDVGIGGGVAEVVGRLLHELGSSRQVLCVTHLPQVAAQASWQWQVVKSIENESVVSTVFALSDEDRVEEIARMLGGVEITPITRKHAREMLGYT